MDTLELIDARIASLQLLYDRMDKTAQLVRLEPYTLVNFKGKEIAGVVNVRPNQPAVFAHAIIADLLGAKWQMVVEGKVTDRQAHVIEQFIEDNLALGDETLLRKFGMPSLFSWLCNHVCIRGFIGVRWLALADGKDYKIDCLPVDMRWTPFEFGNDGLKWVTAITHRAKEVLEAEYPGVPITGKTDIEVRDYWDGDKNEIWIDKTLVKTQKNTLGYPPFVIAITPTGFMLRDKGYIEFEGEDLLFLNRELYDEHARSISIEQTIGMDILFPPYEQEVEVLDAAPAEAPPKSGEVKKVRKGERHEPLARGDLNRASITAREDIQKMLTQGGISDVDLGVFATAPPSALLVTTELEIRGKLLNSRIETLQVFREQLARMMIDQYIKQAKVPMLVGKKGKKEQYSAMQLGDPDSYTISCKLMTKSKRQEVANLAMASAARGFLPLKVILTDILLADDPDGIMRELELENMRSADPAISLFEGALRYAEEAEETEDEVEADAKKLQSMMLTERGVSIIRQRMQPAQPELPEKAQTPQVKEEKGSSNALIPLLGQRGMMGGAA